MMQFAMVDEDVGTTIFALSTLPFFNRSNARLLMANVILLSCLSLLSGAVFSLPFRLQFGC